MQGRHPWFYVVLGGAAGMALTLCLLVAGGLGYRLWSHPPATAEPPTPSPIVRIETRIVIVTATPTATPPWTPTPLPSDTPTPRPTASPAPPPTATWPPTASLPTLPTPVPVHPTTISHPGDTASYAPSLLPAERPALDRLDDPPRYTLDVTLDWAATRLRGREKVLFTNNEGVPLAEIIFRLYPNAPHYGEGSLAIESARVDGAAVPFELEVEDTVLRVPLPTPLPPEAQTELALDFVVTVPRRQDRFGFYDNVMALGHWYPMLSVYDDEGWHTDPYVPIGDAFYSEVGHYTVNLTLPADLVVAATGIKAAQQRNADGTVTMTYQSGATRDFALALSPDFETVRTTVGGTTITSFYLPGDEANGRTALDVAAGSVQVYGERFGAYPYTELDVAETHFLVDGSPGGMEFPGLVFISSEFYQPDGMYALLDMLAMVVSHEVAHQWWYGVIGNDQVDDPWLDEAFAVYASILYFEDTAGEQEAAMQLMMQCTMPYQTVAMMGADRPIATSLLEFDDMMLYSSIVYGKGGLFLNELREMLGDERFFAMLHGYFDQHRYGIVRPQDFQAAVLQAAGEDRAAVAELYDTWVLSAQGLSGDAVGGLGGFGDLESLMPMIEALLGGEGTWPGEH